MSSSWTSTFKLHLAMLSYSTGITIPKLATPMLLKTNVGIPLLIPILLGVSLIITVPCMFMELALGQYSNRAAIRIWDLCPMLKGIGFCSFLTFLLYQTYCNFLCTCTLCFTILSIISEPHWKSCNRSWNKVNCFTLRDNFTRRLECSQKYSKEKCDKMQWESSVEQYYFYRILHIDESGFTGFPQQELLFYALVTMILVFIANYGGSKTTEKFLVVLAIVPTFQMVILFFAPLSDTNGSVTLNHFFKQFNVTNLGDLKTWIKVVNLSLSGPGLGFGAYVTFGTCNTFRTPLHFKVIVLSLVNVLFTILYTTIVQNFIISLCIQSKMLYEDFFELEQKLMMPDAVFFLEHSSTFWMVMWLSNSYMMGLRSLIAMMWLNTEILYNSKPDLRKQHSLWILIFSIVTSIGTIFLSTKIGYAVVKTLEGALSKFSIPFLNTIQLIGVVYFYGILKFKNDVDFMLGVSSSGYWYILYVVNTFLLGTVLVYSVHDFYFRPESQIFWISTLKSVLIWFSLGFIVLYGFFYLLVSISRQNLKIFHSTPDWGPRYPSLKLSRRMFKAYNVVTKEYLYRQERFSQPIEESSV